MIISFSESGKLYSADLSKPIDISIPIRHGAENPNCFWAPTVEFSPVVMGNFIGSTTAGGAVNFFNVRINPHGNGTHTECVGHIAKEHFSIRETLQSAHFFAKLVSIYPEKTVDGDTMISANQLKDCIQKNESKALIIRTLPNNEDKKKRQYSGSNPPYLTIDAVQYLVESGVEHLLLDLPSVDREEDGGLVLGHHIFWQYPSDNVRVQCTITELVFVEDAIQDGYYLLNLQTASFDLDVSPSKPVLFALF